MKIILLTHERELRKKTNTGALIPLIMGEDAQLLVWRRKEADQRLLDMLLSKKAALLFPELKPREDAGFVDQRAPILSRLITNVSINDYEYFVILDATWQQARKMYRQSAYLQNADKVFIHPQKASSFKRRRNQLEEGLCTAECVLELLSLSRQEERYSALKTSFDQFNNLTT